jgi:Protein of unknown function (DUF4231)
VVFKTMTSEEYISQRVDQFRSWYDSKAVKAKSWYFKIRVTAVIGSLLVPVAANAIPQFPDWSRGLTTSLSLLVSLAVGLDSVFHYGDQWKNYRSTEQFLSREKFLFQTGEGPYRDLESEKAFALLVDRCEDQIAAENPATLNVISMAAQPSETKPAKPA